MSGRALVILLVAAGCDHARDPRSPRVATASLHDRFIALDQTLRSERAAMCAELGRDVPPAAAPEPPAPRLPDPAARDAACAAGDMRACFWSANAAERGLDTDAAGKTVFPPKDLPRARELYARSCDGNYDNGCLWLNSLLRDERDHTARVALVHRLCAAGRLTLCAQLWSDFGIGERREFGAPATAALRRALDSACKPGDGEPCYLRARLECDVGGACPADSAEARFETACRNGSALGCVEALGHLDGHDVERTEAVVAAACPRGACSHLVAALAASCRAGVATSCYLASNACINDHQTAPPEQDGFIDDAR